MIGIEEFLNVFQHYGLMEYGTIYGHGAYLGPDFTADYLHRTAQFLARQYGEASNASVEARVATELHANTYDPKSDILQSSDRRGDSTQPFPDAHRTHTSSSPSPGRGNGASSKTSASEPPRN